MKHTKCPECSSKINKEEGKEIYTCTKCGWNRDYECLSHIFHI